MSARTITTILLFILSEAAGLALGEWFFRLYVKAIPPVGLSEFTTQSSHVAHLAYGAGVGIVLFLWALLGMAIDRMMQMTSKSATKS